MGVYEKQNFEIRFGYVLIMRNQLRKAYFLYRLEKDIKPYELETPNNVNSPYYFDLETAIQDVIKRKSISDATLYELFNNNSETRIMQRKTIFAITDFTNFYLKQTPNFIFPQLETIREEIDLRKRYVKDMELLFNKETLGYVEDIIEPEINYHLVKPRRNYTMIFIRLTILIIILLSLSPFLIFIFEKLL